jgi:hypothetical protein
LFNVAAIGRKLPRASVVKDSVRNWTDGRKMG